MGPCLTSGKKKSDVRLVCKSWKAAFDLEALEAYPAILEAEGRDLTYNTKNLLPDLFITKLTTDPDLRSKAAFNHITSLSVFKSHGYNDQIDLSLLPASLKVLETKGFWAETAEFARIACTKVTKLTFHWQHNSPEEIYELLQQLPAVQASHLQSLSLTDCLPTHYDNITAHKQDFDFIEVMH